MRIDYDSHFLPKDIFDDVDPRCGPSTRGSRRRACRCASFQERRGGAYTYDWPCQGAGGASWPRASSTSATGLELWLEPMRVGRTPGL